jgi:hypothetical protein
MVPAATHLLEATLVELAAEQAESIETATFLGWSEQSTQEFDNRSNRIHEIRAALQISQT